jgi:hypothetical protein
MACLLKDKAANLEMLYNPDIDNSKGVLKRD